MSHNLTPSDDIPPELIGIREPITPEQFEELCSQHRKLRLELTSTGELIIMPPTGFESGRRNSTLTYQLEAWARTDGSGVCVDSSVIFAGLLLTVLRSFARKWWSIWKTARRWAG